MKRNYIIDDIKVLFAIAIACSHYTGSVFESYIVVDCFFILSGYFLISNYESQKFADAYAYTKNRIKKLYGKYILAFVILFVWKNLRLFTNGIEWLKEIAKSLPEIFLLQNTGIFPGGINYPLWQLCTLIIASHILYSLLEKDKKMTINVFCPILIICVYTCLSNLYGNQEIDIWGVEYHFFYIPIFRAFAAISIGMVIYRPINEAANYINKLHEWKYNLLSLTVIGSFWLNRNTYIGLISFALVLMFSLCPKGFFKCLNKKTPISGERLSLWLYLNHAFIIDILQTYNIKLIGNDASWIHKGCFIVILISYSILTNQFFEWTKILWKKYQETQIKVNV